MGKMKQQEWLTHWGQDIAHSSSDRISHCIADFVSSLMSKKGFVESTKLLEDVLAEMVEAQESMREYHQDNWH